MTYLWQVAIIVPAASKDAAEQAARAINSGGPNYDGEAFNVLLSASGSDPASHFGLCTSATDQMVAAMFDCLALIPGALYWRTDIEGVLVASNVTAAENQPWEWPDSLDAAGLRAVEKPFG